MFLLIIELNGMFLLIIVRDKVIILTVSTDHNF